MQRMSPSEVGPGDRSRQRPTQRPDDLRWVLATRFFAQAPEHPGFLATPTPTGPVIPIFTSLALLAGHAGPVRWLSTTGGDLIALAPVGHRFVIDPGTPSETTLDPSAFVSAVTATSETSRPPPN